MAALWAVASACGVWELRGSCYPHAGAVRPSAGAAHQRVGEQGPSRARNSAKWKVDTRRIAEALSDRP